MPLDMANVGEPMRHISLKQAVDGCQIYERMPLSFSPAAVRSQLISIAANIITIAGPEYVLPVMDAFSRSGYFSEEAVRRISTGIVTMLVNLSPGMQIAGVISMVILIVSLLISGCYQKPVKPWVHYLATVAVIASVCIVITQGLIILAFASFTLLNFLWWVFKIAVVVILVCVLWAIGRAVLEESGRR